MNIGRYGYSGRLYLNVFFPLLDSDDSGKKYSISMDKMEFFLNSILLPAMQEAAATASNAEHLIPLSVQNEKFKRRNVMGQFKTSSTYVREDMLAPFVQNMNEIIANNHQSEEYRQFGEFFFYSFAFGTKVIFHVQDVSSEVDFDAAFMAAITDINWSRVNLNKDVVFDFAVNIAKAPTATGEEFTGLWTAADASGRGVGSWSKSFDTLRNRLLMQGGFLNTTTVPNSRYRHNMFALFRSIDGFRYNPLATEILTTNEDGSGGGQAPLHFSSMQAYHTIKSPFYTPKKGGFRMTKDILMEDFATDPDAGFKRMEEYLNICNDMLNKRYPLRYELSFKYLNGREFVCNRLENINR